MDTSNRWALVVCRTTFHGNKKKFQNRCRVALLKLQANFRPKNMCHITSI